jgi:hypothetical protein
LFVKDLIDEASKVAGNLKAEVNSGGGDEAKKLSLFSLLKGSSLLPLLSISASILANHEMFLCRAHGED